MNKALENLIHEKSLEHDEWVMHRDKCLEQKLGTVWEMMLYEGHIQDLENQINVAENV